MRVVHYVNQFFAGIGGEAPPGSQGPVAQLWPGARRVFATDAGEELVDVVDDAHQAVSAHVSRPQPSVLCAQ